MYNLRSAFLSLLSIYLVEARTDQSERLIVCQTVINTSGCDSLPDGYKHQRLQIVYHGRPEVT